MHWPLALFLAATPDAGVAERQKPDYSGLIEYGTSRAAENWGPQKPERTQSVLDTTSGDLKVRGQRPPEPVRELVGTKAASVERCAKPQLERSFVLEFELDANGFVSSGPVVHATPADAAFERCVAGELSRWLFPKSADKGRAQFTFPLKLTPR